MTHNNLSYAEAIDLVLNAAVERWAQDVSNQELSRAIRCVERHQQMETQFLEELRCKHPTWIGNGGTP